MTEFSFYHLLTTSLETALPKLLERVMGLGHHAVVMLGSGERVASVSSALWTYDPGSFLAHGSARDGFDAPRAALQPIWLTDRDENPNDAKVLILADGAVTTVGADYVRCLDIFDGNSEDAVVAARGRYKAIKDAGHPLKYFRQTETGWDTRAENQG